MIHQKNAELRTPSPGGSGSSPVGSSGEAMHGGSGSEGVMSRTQSEADVDEDWDAEFGIDTQAKPAVLSMRLENNASAPVVQKAMPQRHKTLEALANKPIELVRFPPPTYLWSLKTESGHSFMHENDLEDWLSEIVYKHVQPGTIVFDALRKTKSPRQGERPITKYTPEWARKTLDKCAALFMQKDETECWAVAKAFLRDISDPQSIDQGRKDHKFARALSEAGIEAMEIVGQIWKYERQPEWLGMIQAVLSMCSVFQSSMPAIVALVESEAYASAVLRSEAPDVGGTAADPGKAFVTTFVKLKETGEKKLMPSQGNLIAQMRALLDAHAYFGKIDPFSLCKTSEDIAAKSFERHTIGDYVTRVKEIAELYTKIPISPLKARACFALAQDRINIGDWATAEKMLFETLFILDKVTLERHGFPLVVSFIGIAILKAFGEVLLHNSKYQYAVCCFEGAILVADLVRKPKEHFALLRRLAEISQEKHDDEKSIALYNEILKHYIAELKMNEAVFVTNVLADLYQDRGEFAEAQFAIATILRLLTETKPRSLTDSAPMDPQLVAMEQRLASLYLRSFWFERGIETLESLNAIIPRRVKKQAVIAALADAYARKGWFNECKHTMFAAPDSRDSPAVNSGTPRRKASFSDPMDKRPGDSFTDQFICMSRNYFNAKKYPESFYLIDCAIALCPVSQLTTRGNLFYRRGKILHTICSKSRGITFPTQLKEAPSDIPIRTLSAIQTSYTCVGDILQEAAASYKKAYQCFLTLGDDIRIARAMSRLAGLMLDYVFPAVFLLKLPYDDVTHLTRFDTSTLVAPSPAAASPISRPTSLPKTDFPITTDVIESPATLAADIACDTCYVPLLPNCLMNMAEVRLLQGEREPALAYWKDCKDLILATYFDGPVFMWKSGPARILRRILHVVRRLVRFLMCMDKAVINANLLILDALVLLERDYEQARKRGLRPTFSFDVPPASSPRPGASERERGDSDSLGSDSDTPSTSERKGSRGFVPSIQPTTPLGGAASLRRPSDLATEIKIPTAVVASPSTSIMTPPKKCTSPSFSPPSYGVVEDILHNQTHDECAEECWGLMHHMRTSSRRYSQGKITRQELLSLNQVILREIIRITSHARIRSGSSNFHLHQVTQLIAPSSPSKADLASSLPRNSLLAQAAATAAVGTASGKIGLGGEMDTTYRLDDFSSRHSKLFPKLSYILQVEWMLMYYLPSTGQLHIDIIAQTPYQERQQANLETFAICLRLLQTPAEYACFKVPPETTIGELFDDLCRYYNDTLPLPPDSNSPPLPPCPSPMPVPVSAQTAAQRRLSRLSLRPPPYGHTGERMSISADGPVSSGPSKSILLEASAEFMNELARLSQKLQPDAYSPGAITVAGKQVFYGPRLSARQLGLARQAKGQAAGFAQLSRPPTALVSSCFSVAELVDFNEKNKKPLDLYLYGVAGQTSTEATVSTTPLPLASRLAPFIANLLSVSDMDESSEAPVGLSEAITEMSRLFRTYTSMLPIPREDSQRKQIGTLTVSGSLQTLMPPPAPLVLPRRHGIGAIRDALFSKDKAEPPVVFKPSTSFPTILICSKFVSLLPWELLMGDEPVLRYFSFYDLVKSVRNLGIAEKDKVVPSYFAWFYGAGEKEAMASEERRGRFVVTNTLSHLGVRRAEQPALPAQELSRDCSSIAPFATPIAWDAHSTKKSKAQVSLRKKYKYMRLFDLCSLDHGGTRELLAFVDEGAYPVLLLSFADLADLSPLVLALMRTRPACTAIVVKADRHKAVAQRITKAHEQLVAQQQQQQHAPELSDRYHFLMAVVAEVRREVGGPVVMLNPPAPL